jgi:hypothetical protein
MANQNYCAKCGDIFEEDCDFCTNCGAQKRSAPQGPQSPPAPHPWMQQEYAPPTQPAPPPQYRAQAVPAPYSSPQPPQQVHHVVYQQVSAPAPPDSSAVRAGKTMGVVAFSMMLAGLIPCLGWLNWFTIPFSFLTFIVCVVAAASANYSVTRNKAVIGLILAMVAGVIGTVRLLMGGGCL